jgi:hypothetical protein
MTTNLEVSSRTHLYEHCDSCSQGVVNVGGQLAICRACGGSTRRLRGTHDARSAIDFDPAEAPIERALQSVSPESLHVEQYERPVHHDSRALVEALTRHEAREKLGARMVELARLLRDPTNSGPLAELIDLVEARHG